MRAYTQTSLGATCCLGAALLASTLYAQAPGAPSGPSSNAGPNPGGAVTGTQGAEAGQETNLLISHAVAMAIDATALREEARRGGQQREDPDPKGGVIDPARQLLAHARREMQESQRLLEAGRGQGLNPALQDAANEYVKTLFALCGGPSDRGDGDGANGGRGAVQLGARDRAAVCLINHAVKECLTAGQLLQSTSLMGPGRISGEHLLRHARQMLAEGRETLQGFLMRTDADAGRIDSGGQDRAGGPHGGTSVRMLARHGSAIIDALQQGGGPAAAGAGGAGGTRPAGAPATTTGTAGGTGIIGGGTAAGGVTGGTSPGTSGAGTTRGTTVPGSGGTPTNRGGTPGAPGSGTSGGATPR